MKRLRLIGSLAAAVVATPACGPGADAGEALPPLPQPTELASPASAASGEPDLAAAPGGRVLLTWFEQRGERSVLLLSSLDPSGDGSAESWSSPRTVSDRQHMVNWADFPTVLALDDGRVAVHYAARNTDGTRGASVHVSWSDDGGGSWSEPVVPHRPASEVPGGPGFVSLLPWSDGSLGVVWLTEFEQTALRFTTVGANGAAPETVLDERICDCCQTSAATTSEGAVVVFRDRSAEEVRDISIVRLVDGAWTDPAPVHQDGWTISSCPVNGPMVDADGREVAVAWFTAAGDVPAVNVAFSGDAGASFAGAVRLDDGSPVGRVAVQLLAPGEAAVSWLERVGDRAEVRVRRVRADGTKSASTTVAAADAGRASGFPRMVRSGDTLVFAWTDTGGEDARVRVATARLAEAGS